jgi:hypothetical protein
MVASASGDLPLLADGTFQTLRAVKQNWTVSTSWKGWPWREVAKWRF